MHIITFIIFILYVSFGANKNGYISCKRKIDIHCNITSISKCTTTNPVNALHDGFAEHCTNSTGSQAAHQVHYCQL